MRALVLNISVNSPNETSFKKYRSMVIDTLKHAPFKRTIDVSDVIFKYPFLLLAFLLIFPTSLRLNLALTLICSFFTAHRSVNGLLNQHHIREVKIVLAHIIVRRQRVVMVLKLNYKYDAHTGLVLQGNCVCYR